MPRPSRSMVSKTRRIPPRQSTSWVSFDRSLSAFHNIFFQLLASLPLMAGSTSSFYYSMVSIQGAIWWYPHFLINCIHGNGMRCGGMSFCFAIVDKLLFSLFAYIPTCVLTRDTACLSVPNRTVGIALILATWDYSIQSIMPLQLVCVLNTLNALLLLTSYLLLVSSTLNI